MRRWLPTLAIALNLIAAITPGVRAQQGNVAELIFAGRNLDAIALAKQGFASASATDRQAAFRLAARVCVTLLDLDCARDVNALTRDSLNAIPPSEVQPATVASGLMLWSFIEITLGHYQSVAFVLGEGFPLKLVNAGNDPSLFAELQLLAARRSRLVFDFEASRDHLDKALAGVLSMTGERIDVARLVVRVAGQLLDNYDAERALRLVAAAEPLLQAVPPNSFLAYELRQLRATLAGYRKDFGEVSKEFHLALATLQQLQLAPSTKSFLEASAYNELLGAEVLRGDRDAARTLLQAHPLQASRDAILQRGYFADAHEFNFAVADEFVRLFLNEPSDKGWGDLLKQPPRWTTDPERLQEVQAFGQAAIGLELLRTGRTDEARHELIEAGEQRLATLQERYRKSVYASPLPYWTDQLLFEFAIAATLARAGTPDYDLILGAHVVLNRSLATSADDALAAEALQTSDDRKRIAQSVRTIDYQRAGWEKAELTALAQRLASPAGRSAEATTQDRLRILRTANEFAVQQQRLHAALSDAKGDVDSVASLAAVKSLLLADEALIFYVPMAGLLGKICVRADRTVSSTQQVDGTTAASDARLVQSALTATHPPSIEADSQFPAAAAVRLGKLLFGGLEDCLRASRRLYHVAPDGAAGQVPPAALLAEVPPVQGAGYDLRAARWLIRNHSFVRTSSIDAFVATKKLSKAKRATLDYLGVGDPVLSPPNASTPSGLQSLPQLPETSEEVERVASLFGRPKVRLLRREAATEEAFRLEPLSEFDVVHLATHGLITQELPGLREPSLVFTPDPQGDAFNDGLLTASQIAALPLRARLVVLSACNSARYAPSIIDSGIQGLATSFAIAGVPSMIAALWPIESTLTRDLIVDVFRTARVDHAAIADALAIAVRRHLDGPAPRPLLHPRFWAALVVLGDGSITLDADAPANPRDLGPFAAVNPAEDEEILSGAPLGDDFATATVGAWNGKRSPSLIRRQAIDGTRQVGGQGRRDRRRPDGGDRPDDLCRRVSVDSGSRHDGERAHPARPRRRRKGPVVTPPPGRSHEHDGHGPGNSGGSVGRGAVGSCLRAGNGNRLFLDPYRSGRDGSRASVDRASRQRKGPALRPGERRRQGGPGGHQRQWPTEVGRRQIHAERARAVRAMLGRRCGRHRLRRPGRPQRKQARADRALRGQERTRGRRRLDPGGRCPGHLRPAEARRRLYGEERWIGRAAVARRFPLRHLRPRHPQDRRRPRDRRLRPALDRHPGGGAGRQYARLQQEAAG